MAISIPAATHINVVATEFDYSQKSNLGTERTGSYLSQASMLVYDDILRFQNSTTNPTADISDFNYNQFEGNILWFMDELVGMESDWIKDASNDETTAYGYVQFTEDSVETAVNRYIGHLERFNERSLTRDWVPYSIKLGETLPIPEWLTTLKNSTKTHKEKLDALTYDEVLALAFVHLHSKISKDSNFVLLAKGDIYASKELYKNNHHTNPDAATLTRLEGFFPWRKQNRYRAALASYSGTSIDKVCTFSTDKGTPDKVIACIESKLTLQDGDDLFAAFVAAGMDVTDVTALVHPNSTPTLYTDWHNDLIDWPSGSNHLDLKAFQVKDMWYTGQYGFFFYRKNGHTIWLQNLKDELTRNASKYNFDELCNTIESWVMKDLSGNIINVPMYLVDWWEDDIADVKNFPGYHTPAGFIATAAGVNNPFGISLGYAFQHDGRGGAPDMSKYVIVSMCGQSSVRGQFQTMMHEAGGHAMHINWGGPPPFNPTDKFLSPQQAEDLLKLYIDYKVVQDAKIAAMPAADRSDYEDKAYWDLPMGNIRALDRYGANYGDRIEDEFLARIYSMMAVNPCITFEKDIWSVMNDVSPEIGNSIIPLAIAREIDTEMREVMKLDQRTY